MIDRCLDWIVRRHLLIVGIATVVFVFFSFQVPHVRIDNSVDNFLDASHALNRDSRRYDAVFGPGSGIIVAVETADPWTVPFCRNLLSFTRELDTLNKRIVANLGAGMQARVRDIMGLDAQAAAAAHAFLASLPAKPATVAELDRRFTEDEMVMIEDQSRVPVILKAYQALSPEKKQALLDALSPAYVKEAFSIVTADYVEGGGNKFKVEKMIDKDVADSGTITTAAVDRLRERIRRWDIYDRFLVSRPVPERLTGAAYGTCLGKLAAADDRKLFSAWYLPEGKGYRLRPGTPPERLERLFRQCGYRRAATVIVRMEKFEKQVSEETLRYVRQVIREYTLYRVYPAGPDGAPVSTVNALGERRDFFLLDRTGLAQHARDNGYRLPDSPSAGVVATNRDGGTFRITPPVFPPAENPIHVAGEPVITTMLGVTMVGDLKILIPFVLIIVMASLLLAFRQFGPMIIPLIGVLYSTVIVIGLMALAHSQLTVISVVLPVLMIAVGSAYGIHVVNHFQMDGNPELRDAVRSSLGHVLTPVTMAALTTVGGFMALVTNAVVPVKNFGLFTGIGVLISFVLAVTFIPALLIMFRVGRREPGTGREERENRLLAALSRTSVHRPFVVLSAGAVILILSAVAAAFVKVDTNGIMMFKKSSEIRVADDYLNSGFKGTSTADLVIRRQGQNSALTPRILQAVDGLEAFLKKDPAIGQYVGGVLSVADYIKKAHKAMHGEDHSFYRIPDSRAAILDYMLILKKDTDNVAGPDGDTLRVLLTMRTGSTTVTRRLKKSMEAYFRSFDIPWRLEGNVAGGRYTLASADTNALAEAAEQLQALYGANGTVSLVHGAGLLQVSAGGGKLPAERAVRDCLDGVFTIRPLYLGVLMKYLEVDSMIVMGQVFSMLLSLLVVFILNSIVFRSLIESAISLAPLVVTILLNFGVMAVFGINLDVATSMIASVAIGIGIDYTIHFLSGFKQRCATGESIDASLLHTGLTTGRAILYNAVAVLFGFVVLAFSSFLPLINFGAMIALTMCTTALASLTLIPAILVTVRRFPFFLRLLEREQVQFERAERLARSMTGKKG